MPLNFDKQAQKGKRFLEELAHELGRKNDTRNAGKILRGVFRALRNHLTLEENVQLLAQLPMALKGVYVDGWSPTRRQPNKSRKLSDFLDEVTREEKNIAPGKTRNEVQVIAEIKTVFTLLKKYISEGEFRDMEAVLPKELKELLHDNVHYKKLALANGR